jgi:hypothetical protein
MTAPSCQPGTSRSVDRRDVASEVRTVDGHTIDSGSGQCGSGLERLELALSRNETLKAAGLDSLILILRELSQPIRSHSQILAQHRAARDNLVLDRLLDQLVLTDA